MKEFHYYLPWRIVDRELSVHRYPTCFSIAFGSKSIVLGKWYLALEGLDREER